MVVESRAAGNPLRRSEGNFLQMANVGPKESTHGLPPAPREKEFDQENIF
jgi:hypothetical protein